MTPQDMARALRRFRQFISRRRNHRALKAHGVKLLDGSGGGRQFRRIERVREKLGEPAGFLRV
jgi:hypothetical protein